MPARKRGSRNQWADVAGKIGHGPAKSKDKAGKVEKGLMPSHDEVFAAVASLHDDELKPFGRILRKRIAEIAVNAGLDSDVAIKYVQAVCEASSLMKVAPEEGGDWSVVITDREHTFIDIYSPCDNYPNTLWDSMSTYFESPEQKDMILPGGRYSCAQALLARRLPCLSGYSLGKVCHIVQLAITPRKILGYSNGCVVPYARSQVKMKEDLVMSSQPCKSSHLENTLSNCNSTTMPIASWEITRRYLQEILDIAPESAEGKRTVPLSNVKRLFMSKFNIELSETMLGHSKLSELLLDPRLNDICTVQLGTWGYVVVQVCGSTNSLNQCNMIESMSIKCDQTESTESIDSEAGRRRETSAGSSPRDFVNIELEPPLECLDLQDDFDDDTGWSMAMSPDFFDQDEPPRRSKFCFNEPLEGIEEVSSSSQTTAQMHYSRCSMFSPPMNLNEGRIGSIAVSKIRNTFIQSPLLPPTPLRNSAARRAHSLPRNVGSDNNAWEATIQSLNCRCATRTSANDKDAECGIDFNNCTTPSVYDCYTGTSFGPLSPGCTGAPRAPPSPSLIDSPTCFRTYSPYTSNPFYPPKHASAPLPCSFESPQLRDGYALKPLPWSFEQLQLNSGHPPSPTSKVIYLSSYLA
jgi:hypothetical protein